MRGAVIATLQALYDGKEVTADKSLECGTTRITNEISTLRNALGIDIITDRVETETKKWYGSYRLIRNDENLKKVSVVLGLHSETDEAQESRN